MTFRPGFVLEQTLGHVTHSMNLKRFLRDDSCAEPRWLDVPFRPSGRAYSLPPLSLNWSLRGGYYARGAVAAAGKLDALFVHTLTVGLLSTGHYDRIPTVLSLDATPINLDSLAEAYNHRRQPGIVEEGKRRITSSVLGHAKGYVAWSEWTKASMVQDYGVDGEKVAVIPPGTDLDIFRCTRGREQEHRLPRILFVGGDFARKGGNELLQAYRSRLKGRAELHLVTPADIEAEEGVHVYRNLTANSEPLLELFRTADIFALPTHADCLPLVMGEAMAASLPVVSTDVGAIAEAVEDGVSGYVVAKADEAGLGDALERLVDDPRLRRRMGEAGRQIAEERFDACRNAHAVLSLLEGIAG